MLGRRGEGGGRTSAKCEAAGDLGTIGAKRRARVCRDSSLAFSRARASGTSTEIMTRNPGPLRNAVE